MRYRLRTLVIAMGLAPPALAGLWFTLHWIANQYASPAAERLVAFATILLTGVALVCWIALIRSVHAIVTGRTLSVPPAGASSKSTPAPPARCAYCGKLHSHLGEVSGPLGTGGVYFCGACARSCIAVRND
jgi:hypothetical protein